MNRMATLATVSLLIDKESEKPGTNIQRALSLLEEAEKWKPDIVVFPEEINIVGLPKKEIDSVVETVPDGPILKKFAASARRYKTNIVVGIRERDGDRLYNTAVIIDRSGKFVGKYRKTHLAPDEFKDKIQPGDSYPVFDLDFGKIGVLICMDLHYPEIWRILALQGADVIVHPTMWLDYTGDLCESLVNSRAIDNQVYVVTSHYIQMPFLVGKFMGHSRIVDPYGRTRASTGHLPGVAVARVDLDQAYEFWLKGEEKKKYPTLKECFLGMRRPETYKIITRPDKYNSWKIKEPTLYEKD